MRLVGLLLSMYICMYSFKIYLGSLLYLLKLYTYLYTVCNQKTTSRYIHIPYGRSLCFGSGFFSRIRISLFFLSPDPYPDRPKIRIRSGNIPDPDPWKKHPKTGVKVKKVLYFISSTLNVVLFGQTPPKPYQNHHLDPISLFMDGSGLLEPGSGSAKKPGSIRIRNTV